jgi:nicotinamide-nucleotide amidase
MLRDGLLPRLLMEFPPRLRSAVIHTCGLRESEVELRTRPLLQEFPELLPAWCASLGAVRVTLSLPAGREDELAAAAARARQLFGHDALEQASPASDCLALARRHRLRLASAESCTGGLISAALTDVPGASEVFVGGIVCYANEWKQSLLQVPQETIALHGAVSEATAQALAAGLRRFADCGVVSTGVAGPGGGSPEKPVGTVWIATIAPNGIRSRLLQLRGERKDIRSQAVTLGLDSLRRHLLDLS